MNKKEIKEKVQRFKSLMEELSSDIVSIFNAGEEDVYKETVLEMLTALDEAQQTVKKAYNLYFSKE